MFHHRIFIILILYTKNGLVGINTGRENENFPLGKIGFLRTRTLIDMDLNGYWWYWPPVFFVVLPCTYSHCYGMVCIMLVVGSHSGSVRIHIPLDSLIFRSWRPQTSSTWVLLYVYHPWPAPFLSLITLTYRKTDECRWSWHKMENKILALSMNGKVLWLSGCRMVDENDEPLVVISLSSTGVRVSTSPLVGSLITSSWLPSLLNLLCSYFA